MEEERAWPLMGMKAEAEDAKAKTTSTRLRIIVFLSLVVCL